MLYSLSLFDFIMCTTCKHATVTTYLHFTEDKHGYAAVQDVLGSYRAQQELPKTDSLRDSSKPDSGTKVVVHVCTVF